MKRMRGTHLAVLAIAGLFVVALTVPVFASNMAFKINMQLVGSDAGCTDIFGNPIPCCAACDNWISLPFNNQFEGGGIRQFCDSDGDGVNEMQFVTIQGTKTGFFPPTFDLTRLDGFITHTCAIAGTDNPIYQSTRAVRVRPLAGTSPAIIYVGSHNPGGQVLVRGAAPAGSCGDSACDNWVDVVYHTTATNLRPFCDSNGDGLVDASDTIQFVTIQGKKTSFFPVAFDLDQVDGFITHTCAIAGTDNPEIQIGRPVRLRTLPGSGDALISPSHF